MPKKTAILVICLCLAITACDDVTFFIRFGTIEVRNFDSQNSFLVDLVRSDGFVVAVLTLDRASLSTPCTFDNLSIDPGSLTIQIRPGGGATVTDETGPIDIIGGQEACVAVNQSGILIDCTDPCP